MGVGVNWKAGVKKEKNGRNVRFSFVYIDNGGLSKDRITQKINANE